MSEQTVVKFMNLGWIKTYADLFLLKDYAEAMAQLEGFGLRSTQKLLAAIERARNVDAQHFLFALSIPLCGQDVCRRLLQAYPLTDLMTIARQPNAELGHSPLAEIAGIGPEKSSQFERWFRDEEHFNIVTRLMQQLHISQPPVTQQGNRCAGLTFVITGDVVHYKNRNALKAYIESQGGKVTGSVSKSTRPVPKIKRPTSWLSPSSPRTNLWRSSRQLTSTTTTYRHPFSIQNKTKFLQICESILSPFCPP